MERLRRISSVSSFSSSLLRRSSSASPEDTQQQHGLSRSSAPSIATSALNEALSSDILSSEAPPPDPLTIANATLTSSLEAVQSLPRTAFAERLSLLIQIQDILAERKDTRNTFRDHGGFLTAVSVLSCLDPGEGENRGEDENEMRYVLASHVFEVIAIVVSGQDRNAAELRDSVGFEAVEEAIKFSKLMLEDEGAEKILSIVFSFLTNDFLSPPIFTQLRNGLTLATDLSTRYSTIDTLIETRFDSHKPSAVNAEALGLLLSLQAMLKDTASDLRYMVISALLALAEGSRRSLVALSEAGGVAIVLKRLVRGEVRQKRDLELWKRLLARLLEMGAGTQESRTLFQKVVEGWELGDGRESLNVEILGTILKALPKSRRPSFFNFDLSQFGYSSITMRSLGRSFPPTTHGYTFMAWISIVSPPTAEEGQQLTVFGVGDAAGKCHLEVSINALLQVAVSTTIGKPGVPFTSFTFDVDRFYHIAIVHQRPRFSSTSPLSLFVDGKLVEVQRATYPVASPKDWEVQAWLGTPKERVHLAARQSTISWNLGPCYLIHGDIPEEMIYVVSTLGPRYASNFQDQLGQFQTNASSTRLNIRIAAVSRAIPAQSSPLVHAIRDKGSAVIPEHRIIFAFSALNVLVSGSDKGISGSGLSAHAQQILASTTAARGSVVINSAIPKVEDALMELHGLGFLEGAPCASNPRSLDVAIWKIGGAPVLLRLVELAQTSLELTLAVRLFYEFVSESWRNSDDVERVQGYEVLGFLLRKKAELITVETHDALIELGGFETGTTNSTVSNSLAFRFVLLDLGLWGSTAVEVQRKHFKALQMFMGESEHHDFNIRRLTKMHITRKLLFALRVNYFDHALIPDVVSTLMAVVRTHFTTETIRHLATFLTASLCQVQQPSSNNGIVGGSTWVDPTTSFVLDASLVDPGSSRPSLLVLEALHSFLLDSRSSNELAKFSRTITTKWALLMLLDKNTPPYAAVLALRILVRLLQSQGNAYVGKFVNLDGFSILRAALPRLWNFAQLHLALFALLHGHDITKLDLDAPFGSSTFALSATELSPVASDVMRVVLAAVARGLKQLANTDIAVPTVVISLSSAEAGAAPTTTRDFLTLSAGFNLLLDLVSQTDRSVGSSHQLLTSPTSLSDLTSALLPFIPPLPTVQYPSSALYPPLPILSSANSFRLNPQPSTPKPPYSATQNSLPKLQIPLSSFASEIVTSPVSALENERPLLSFSASPTRISAAATSLLQLLSQLSMYPITSRHHHHTRSDSSGSNNFSVLAVLQATMAAGASVDTAQQVAFRTSLVSDIYRRLSRASLAMAEHVSTFVTAAVDLSLQGWHQDIHGLMTFALGYVEKLLAENDSQGVPVERLFKSINLLVLLSLSLPVSDMQDTLNLLVHHQLTIFASSNTDISFLECLIHRLHMLLQGPSHSRPSKVVDLFKLLILQRPNEVEAIIAGQQQSHPSKIRTIEKLIDADDETSFVTLLEKCRSRLGDLRASWKRFVDSERSRSRQCVELEVVRLEALALSAKVKRDSQRRRTRKQRENIYEWGEGIKDVEQMRFFHTRQDLGDLALFVESEWGELSQNILRKCGVWEASAIARKWRLDFTEGHCRMRKKLQPEDYIFVKPSPISLATPNLDRSRTLGTNRQDSFSRPANSLELDTPLQSPTTNGGDDVLWGERAPKTTERAIPVDLEGGDPYDEDKNRKVRRNLESGDVIFAVFNTSRIIGLDAVPGLLLLAKKNIYIVDHFFQTANGELVDAWDSPEEERDQHLQTLAELAGRKSGTDPLHAKIESSRRSRRWNWADVTEVHERKYLFRNVALELFFRDGRSFLLIFTKEERQLAYALIDKHSPAAVAFGSLYESNSSLGLKMTDAVLGHHRTKLERMTQRWERREVSNFEYLTFINTSAGRTSNDLTQYPVFPWVVADHTSDTLDLSLPSTFRDLSKPMGAQTEGRQKEFRERYAQLVELQDGTTPFHFGTHYSSAMSVVGFLLRLPPFTESYLDLQGGEFDHADRMFWSIPKAWASASSQSRSDVRELIPEFFYLSDFLINANHLELGTRQDGNRIDDVELPPWAKHDPRLFIQKHREALESEYVSTNLCHWIDLIFGYKQVGEAAEESLNVFHSLSYEGAIDLDAIEDPDERRAAVSTIHNFGQTPRQLFTRPHPARTPRLIAKATHPLFSPDLSIEQQAITLLQSIIPVADLGGRQVAQIYAASPDRITASPCQSLLLPEDFQYTLSYGYSDQTVRLHAKGNNLPISLFENPHSEVVSAAVFADLQILVTGSTDSSVSMWKWRWRSHGKDGHLQQLKTLRGHSDQIRCVAASRAFSIFVSGSNDKSAVIWDLNRHRFVHRLQGHEGPVQTLAISNTTGDIATCTGAVLRIWTVNGVLIASRSTSNSIDPILAVAFSMSETSPIVATSHSGGRISLWKCTFSSGWKIEHLHTLQHKNRLKPNSQPDITALAFTSRTLYSGDSLGQTWLWNPPGTELFLPDSTSGSCMNCRNTFSLMESRKRCSSCAGIFCSLCTTTSLEIGGRFCAHCFSSLSPLMATATLATP